MTTEGIVVVFDFDKTIVEVDSDNWVVDELGFTDLFNQLLPTMPWNSLMGTMMSRIHSAGTSAGDVACVLKRIPIHPRIVAAIKSAHSLGCDLRIVSDANTFFIETILDHLGLRECFSEINTNPGHVDQEGCVSILPCHDFNKWPHGCALCPPNMCKGLIIERIQAEIGEKKMIYLGDGSGDYCPSLRLKASDFVMPRRHFPMWELIRTNPSVVRAHIHDWAHGEEQELILIRIINSILSADVAASRMLLSNSEFQILSAGAPHGAFSKVVTVRRYYAKS